MRYHHCRFPSFVLVTKLFPSTCVPHPHLFLVVLTWSLSQSKIPSMRKPARLSLELGKQPHLFLTVPFSLDLGHWPLLGIFLAAMCTFSPIPVTRRTGDWLEEAAPGLRELGPNHSTVPDNMPSQSYCSDCPLHTPPPMKRTPCLPWDSEDLQREMLETVTRHVAGKPHCSTCTS